MTYTIILKNKKLTRELKGLRTLAEVLTEEESSDIRNGNLVAIREGLILSLSSLLCEGSTIELCQPTASLLSIFRIPDEKGELHQIGDIEC